MYYSGVSGRGVGILFKMNKSNVYNWNQFLRRRAAAYEHLKPLSYRAPEGRGIRPEGIKKAQPMLRTVIGNVESRRRCFCRRLQSIWKGEI
jgi:hypothetical protein